MNKKIFVLSSTNEAKRSAAELPSIGTNGVITNGMYTRVDEFRDAMRCALGILH